MITTETRTLSFFERSKGPRIREYEATLRLRYANQEVNPLGITIIGYLAANTSSGRWMFGDITPEDAFRIEKKMRESYQNPEDLHYLEVCAFARQAWLALQHQDEVFATYGES